MAPLCGYFTLYTTQQPHYLIQQKKPMPRKMIINQCSCPDSILLLFSCIHKFYETNIYKKKNAIQMSLAYETGVQRYKRTPLLLQ